MYYIISKETINPAQYGIKGELPVKPMDMMNKYPHILIHVGKNFSLEMLETLQKRRGYQFYHKEADAYCLVEWASRSEVWTLEATITFVDEMVEALQLSNYTSRESVQFTRDLVALYNKANNLFGGSLPDFGSAELYDFLHCYLENHGAEDYRSVGTHIIHVEKDHLYKFEKMSDFLKPEDVFEEDGRVVWTTTRDRLKAMYFSHPVEDMLHEFIAIVWTFRKTGEELNKPVVDATSSEELLHDHIYTALFKLIESYKTYGSEIGEEAMSELTTLILMHRDIFNEVCEDCGYTFTM